MQTKTGEKAKLIFITTQSHVEPVFAKLKHNNGFRRFSLKGLQKVELEFGPLALRNKIAA